MLANLPLFYEKTEQFMSLKKVVIFSRSDFSGHDDIYHNPSVGKPTRNTKLTSNGLTREVKVKLNK